MDILYLSGFFIYVVRAHRFANIFFRASPMLFGLDFAIHLLCCGPDCSVSDDQPIQTAYSAICANNKKNSDDSDQHHNIQTLTVHIAVSGDTNNILGSHARFLSRSNPQLKCKIND